MFSETVYLNQTFEKSHFSNEKVQDVEFYKCTFINCSFQGAIFWDCSFEHCVFKHCDLSNINIEGSTFSNVSFQQSKIIGVSWHKAGLSFKADFTDCIISYSSFFKRNLKNFKIIDCVAKEVDFAECNLQEAVFYGTNLEKTRFLKTDLRKANFTGASNYSVDFDCNKVKKAVFSLPEALSLFNNFDVVIK